MTTKPFVYGAFLALIALFLCSCAAYSPMPLGGEFVHESRAREVLSSLLRRSQDVASVKALLRATINYGREKDLVRYAVNARKGGELRVETLPVSGIYTLALFVSNGEVARLIISGENEFVESDNPDDLLQRMLHAPVGVQELMYLLAGYVPPSRLTPGETGVYENLDKGLVTLVAADGSSRILADTANFSLRQYQLLGDSGDVVMDLVRSGPLEGVLESAAPSITLYLPGEGVRIDLQYQTYEKNQEIRDSLFELP